MYGIVPPFTDTDEEPLLKPKQLMSWPLLLDVTDAVLIRIAGSVKLTVFVSAQLLMSVIITE